MEEPPSPIFRPIYKFQLPQVPISLLLKASLITIMFHVPIISSAVGIDPTSRRLELWRGRPAVMKFA